MAPKTPPGAEPHTTEDEGDLQVWEPRADETQPVEEKEWKPNLHERLIIYTITAITLIVSLDASIIVTPLNAIVVDLGGTATQSFWIGTSYLLVNAVTMPFICSLSDIFGRPICIIFSLVMFTVGTVFCATAPNIALMLAGRSVQGVGGAGIHSLGLVTMTDIVPLRYRPKAYSVILAGWALGLTAGPVIGGAIAERTTWRWIFYIMFPILGLGLVAVPYLLTLKPREATFREKLARVDFFGGAIFTASATSFLVAISWGGTQYAWDSAQSLVPLILGAAGLTATVLYEIYMAKNPFLQRNLFRDVSSVITYILACAHGILVRLLLTPHLAARVDAFDAKLYGYLYYLPFFFLSVKSFSALLAGVALLPVMTAVMVSSVTTGRLLTRLNKYKWAISAGWLLGTAGAALSVALGDRPGAGVWAPALVLLGLGQGAVMNAQNFAAQAMADPGAEAGAAATYAFARQFGSAVGVGIGGTTFQNVMARKLASEGLPADIARHAETFVGALHALPPGAEKDGIRRAYAAGFQGVFALYLGLSGAALVLGVLCISNLEMNKDHRTEHRLDGSRLRRLLAQGSQQGIVDARRLEDLGPRAAAGSAPTSRGTGTEARGAPLEGAWTREREAGGVRT
ncbi:major facilitator superfamily transporter [Xylariomycetidae sp. FL0641]|nr:major facilitator superfamily transporter [Xylariomycetidae sp. FL0641]